PPPARRMEESGIMSSPRTRRLAAGIALALGLCAAGGGCNNFPVASLASGGAPVARAAQPDSGPAPIATTGDFARVSGTATLQARSEVRWSVETPDRAAPLSGQAVVGPDGTVVLG